VDFSILADRADGAWASHWRRRVEETLDADPQPDQRQRE
jgi:hypothetical protein